VESPFCLSQLCAGKAVRMSMSSYRQMLTALERWQSNNRCPCEAMQSRMVALWRSQCHMLQSQAGNSAFSNNRSVITTPASSESTSSETSTLTSISSSTYSSESTSSSNTNAVTSNPSSGAKIGVGVGIAGGVLAISASILACVLLRKPRVPEDGPIGGPNQFYRPQIFYHEAPESKLRPVEALLSTHRTELPSWGPWGGPKCRIQMEVAAATLQIGQYAYNFRASIIRSPARSSREVIAYSITFS